MDNNKKHDQTVAELIKLQTEVSELPAAFGKAAALKSIKNSIWFIQIHKSVGARLRGLILDECHAKVERIGQKGKI